MTVEENNQYKISLPLPSVGECIFFLHGDQTAKQFIDSLHAEDETIKNPVLRLGAAKVSLSTSLERIFRSPFLLEFNGKKFDIIPGNPHAIQMASILEEEPENHVMERLKKEIYPLLVEKVKLDTQAARYANGVIYGGFGFLVAEWCFLARLTWWEFNWDIMEPVTYFVTFGTAVLGYAYFTLTKRDYTFVDLRESILVNKMFKNYTRADFNVDRYFSLEHKLNQIDPTAVETIGRCTKPPPANSRSKRK